MGMPPGIAPPHGGGHEGQPWPPFWLEHCTGVCAPALSAWRIGLSRHVAAPNSARRGGAGSFAGLHPCGVLRASAQCLGVRPKVGTPQPHGQGHRALATAEALCGRLSESPGQGPWRLLTPKLSAWGRALHGALPQKHGTKMSLIRSLGTGCLGCHGDGPTLLVAGRAADPRQPGRA